MAARIERRFQNRLQFERATSLGFVGKATGPVGTTLAGLGPYHLLRVWSTRGGRRGGRQSYFGHELSGFNGLKFVESVRAGLKVDILIR